MGFDRRFLGEDEFRKRFLALCKEPADVRHPTPALPARPSRQGMMCSRPMKAKYPPSPGRWVSYHRDFDRKRFRLAVRLKIRQRTYHIRDFRPGEEEAARLCGDRVAYRVWGEAVLAKLNHPERRDNYEWITPDGIPEDPFEGRARGEGGGA